MSSIVNFGRALWHRGGKNSQPGFRFERPLVLLQSDDWGRVGVRDKEGYEKLRASGISLGQHPYDFYTLETAEDVGAVAELLKRHHDATGRSPCLVMNFVTANIDFQKTLASGASVELLPLSKGLPGSWSRPGLLDAYKHGIRSGLFYAALHGRTHFCLPAVEYALAEGQDNAHLLHTMWQAETPYIYWRMPWVGYEYCNPDKPRPGFLAPGVQQDLIRLAAEGFAKLFSSFPASACAPGYRANRDTHAAWSKWGIRVAQNGSGAPRPPHFDEFGILHVYRTIDVEPSQRELQVEKYMQLADDCFAHGMPAVISLHAINFHSTLRNFRDLTLQALDQLLSALEAKYPGLLYVHDADLYKIVTQGKFDAGCGPVLVGVKPEGVLAAQCAE